MAEAILRDLVGRTPDTDAGTLAEQVAVSSAGTGPWHVGEPMDPRAATALAKRGYPDHGHQARQIEVTALEQVDLVVCLDRRHLETLRSLTTDPEVHDRLVMLRAFDHEAQGGADIADPYYGDDEDFDQCLERIETACHGLVRHLAESINGGDN